MGLHGLKKGIRNSEVATWAFFCGRAWAVEAPEDWELLPKKMCGTVQAAWWRTLIEWMRVSGEFSEDVMVARSISRTQILNVRRFRLGGQTSSYQ